MDGTYSKKVLKYFKNPRNMGRIGNADGFGKVGNIICGDLMQLYIKVGKNKKRQTIIKDARFETFGCVAAIATSSMITTLVKGKTLEEALKVTKQDIVKSLGGLPQIKLHCSVLAADALSEAIYDYLLKNNLPISSELKEKHEIIVKETKEIEKKYKNYIKMEKKIWKMK
jgi:nitrogen fixation NifU-like protein